MGAGSRQQASCPAYDFPLPFFSPVGADHHPGHQAGFTRCGGGLPQQRQPRRVPRGRVCSVQQGKGGGLAFTGQWRVGQTVLGWATGARICSCGGEVRPLFCPSRLSEPSPHSSFSHFRFYSVFVF